MQIKVELDYHLKGKSSNDKGSFNMDESVFTPYDTVMQGLSACFMKVFKSVAKGHKLDFENVSMLVNYEFQGEPPYRFTTVDFDIKMKVKDKSKLDLYKQCLGMAEQGCPVSGMLRELGVKIAFKLELV